MLDNPSIDQETRQDPCLMLWLFAVMEVDIDITMEMFAGILETSVDEPLSAVVGSELVEKFCTVGTQ